MRICKGLSLAIVLVLIAINASGCFWKPYDKPEYKEIKPSQTAFLIPLEGDATRDRRSTGVDEEEVSRKIQLSAGRLVSGGALSSA